MAKLSAFVSLGTCLLFVLGPLSHQADADDQIILDSELELKRMLSFVSPLMSILRSDQHIKQSTDVLGAGWVSRAISNGNQRNGGYGGGHDTCCNDGHDYLALISLISLGLLFLFLITLLSTTTTGRRKRSEGDNLLTIEEILSQQDVVLLDGPTWLSMVHELWEQDSALENTACTQETLCRMNRLAMAAPGQAGWAVSLSSLPLSYLLHTRHTGGFGSYMDAALMGRSGANCTELYKSCPRLSY